MENRKRSFHRQNGASLIEYALLVSLIALAAIPSVRGFGLKTGLKMCQGTTIGGSGTASSVYFNPQNGCYNNPCVDPSCTVVFSNGTPSCLNCGTNDA